MSDKKNSNSIPDRDQIKHFIQHNTSAYVKKSDIATHFSISGDDRVELKKRLADMVEDGELEKGRGQKYRLPDALPPVVTTKIATIDQDGFLIAVPEEWDEIRDPPPILIDEAEANRHKIQVGEKVMLRIAKVHDGEGYVGHVLKRFAIDSQNLQNGFIRMKGNKALFYSAESRKKKDIEITKKNLGDAKDGDFVQVHFPSGRGQPSVEAIMGHETDIGIVSLIEIHNNNLPHTFPDEVVAETEGLTVPPLKDKWGNREDLRDIPLVTIDGPDARDFDDAVYARPDDNPNNSGGFKLIVAIADVAHYVRPGSALDQEAFKRGNSTYFPDRVVPMLPEALSNDLCSLRPNEDRACMAAKITIDNKGQIIKCRVVRALMRSKARLTYEQAQRAIDGQTDETTKPILDEVIKPLYQIYQCLKKAREARGTVDLDMPERKIEIKEGRITEIKPRERLDAHKLIEECMILANVAVSEVLNKVKQALIYRVHGQPDASRLETTKTLLKEIGIKMGKTSHGVEPRDLDAVLDKAKGTQEETLVHELILRTMSQAVYTPDNIGHFGLALDSYAHFTSPIRRYADLVVHRALIRAFGIGDNSEKLTDEENGRLDKIADHISTTERRSMVAERDAMDRYMTLYMTDKVGDEFKGRISGVTNFGLFIRLNESGAEGLVPIKDLHDDYYIYDEARHRLIGRRKKKSYGLCQAVTIKLISCDPLTGQMRFGLAGGHDDGKKSSKRHYKRGGKKSGKPHKNSSKGKRRGKGRRRR